MSNEIAVVLERLKAQAVDLRLTESRQLAYRVPAGWMTPERRQWFLEHKPEIIERLSSLLKQEVERLLAEFADALQRDRSVRAPASRDAYIIAEAELVVLGCEVDIPRPGTPFDPVRHQWIATVDNAAALRRSRGFIRVPKAGQRLRDGEIAAVLRPGCTGVVSIPTQVVVWKQGGQSANA